MSSYVSESTRFATGCLTDPTIQVGVDAVKSISSSTKRPLSPKYRDLLVTGEHWHKSRSEAVRSFALHAVNQGWDWSEYWFHMSQPESYALASVYWRRGGRQSHRSVGDPVKAAQADWNRAVDRVKSNPAIRSSSEARQEVGLIRARFREEPFTGRTAATDSIVLEYFHLQATMRGLIVLFLSTRTISEATGIGRTTVSRSIGRLVERQWLRHAGDRDHVSHASSYRLTQPPVHLSAVHEKQCTDGTQARRAFTGRADCVPSVHSAVHSVGEDVFLKLGRHCALVYEALTEEGRRAEEVMASAGVARRTVFKHLKVLAELGMAQSVEGLWTRTAKSLKEAAGDLGVTGLKEIRAEKISIERTLWKTVEGRIQFSRDQETYGRGEAIRRALERAGEAIPEGVDLETGEVLEMPVRGTQDLGTVVLEMVA